MKNILISITIIGVLLASGSVFYYYVIFLPEHERQSAEDLNAIRRVVAPTPEQQQRQTESLIETRRKWDQAMKEWSECTNRQYAQLGKHLDAVCSQGDTNPFEEMQCRTKEMSNYDNPIKCTSPFGF